MILRFITGEFLFFFFFFFFLSSPLTEGSCQDVKGNEPLTIRKRMDTKEETMDRFLSVQSRPSYGRAVAKNFPRSVVRRAIKN